MKTIARILFILVAIIFVACSENVYLEGGEDGETGPQGPKGDKGDRGYSVVTKVDTVYNVTKDTAIGQFTGYYTDIDTNGVYSVEDIWQGTGIFTPFIHNGTNRTSSTSSISMYKLPSSPECVNGTVVFKIFTNDVLKDSLWFCIPEDGSTYIPTFTSNNFSLNEFIRVHEVYVDGVLLYADTCRNGQDGNPGDQGDPGQSGETGKSFYVFQYHENCDVASSYYYDYLGWLVLGTPVSINHIDAPPRYINGFSEPFYNGTLNNWDYWEEPKTVWCPVFQNPSALNYLVFDIGSKGEWKVELQLMHSDSTITFAKIMQTTLVSDFIWYDNTTYKQKFIYEVKSTDIQSWDVVRWGLLITKVGDFSIPEDGWRDWTFNADNFYWTTISPVE